MFIICVFSRSGAGGSFSEVFTRSYPHLLKNNRSAPGWLKIFIWQYFNYCQQNIKNISPARSSAWRGTNWISSFKECLVVVIQLFIRLQRESQMTRLDVEQQGGGETGSFFNCKVCIILLRRDNCILFWCHTSKLSQVINSLYWNQVSCKWVLK